MNKERLLLLADHVEKAVDLEFNMCTHTTCLIGFTQHLWPDEFDLGCAREAGEALELDPEQYHGLFFPNHPERETRSGTPDLNDITRAQAVTAVREFVASGVIKFWP